jgi:peptidase E
MPSVRAPHVQLVLTSDLPRPGNTEVGRYLVEHASIETLTWTAAVHDENVFQAARAEFESIGIREVVPLSLTDLSRSHGDRSSATYLSGGDPIRFREALIASTFGLWLSDAFASGSVLLGASGGAMQFTTNLSIFRLLEQDLDSVLEQRENYKGLGLVSFEVLPHFDRHSPEFIEKVRLYSERINNDIWCLPDGTAVAVVGHGSVVPIGNPKRLTAGAFT